MLDCISFIIPIYNDNKYLDETLKALYTAIERSDIKSFEILVIDDGSEQPISVNSGHTKPNLKIHRFQNQGRLRARLEGLYKSKFDHIVLLDSRVSCAEDSLKNLQTCHLNSQPTPDMIIAKIVFPSETNLVGLFWDAIARLVWSGYYVDELDLYLTRENFDSLPKGTTFLYARKETLINAYQCLTEFELNNRDTNDDTLLIKRVVTNSEVILSKQFLATYHPRTKLKSFIKHAHHRGKVATGGFFATDTDGVKKLRILLGVIAVLLVVGIYSLFTSLLVVMVGVIYLEIFFARKIRLRHLLSLNMLSIPFLFAYLTGFVRSLFSRYAG
jgi:glycosyltransferase involved in cell wall biosynthesis